MHMLGESVSKIKKSHESSVSFFFMPEKSKRGSLLFKSCALIL